jgi:REP element-mobilizing transposase RayT
MEPKKPAWGPGLSGLKIDIPLVLDSRHYHYGGMPTHPPIIAYHIVFGAYGFWLPNDPRGSWSRYVWADRLHRFGPPQPLSASHQPTADEEQLRAEMKRELQFPPVRFSDLQVRAVASGFAAIIQQLHLVVYATAIMADHVHLVTARQDLYAEDIAAYFKRAGSRALREANLHPLADWPDRRRRLPSPWEAKGWKAFLHNVDELGFAIEYVNNNPAEAGLPRQHWPWIKPYEG